MNFLEFHKVMRVYKKKKKLKFHSFVSPANSIKSQLFFARISKSILFFIKKNQIPKLQTFWNPPKSLPQDSLESKPFSIIRNVPNLLMNLNMPPQEMEI